MRGIRGREREREMAGIWGYVCSTGDSLKGWCWSAYGLGSAAVTKINDGRINATQKLSDEEFRAKIGPFTADLAKNGAIYACQEGLKSIPGLLHTPPLLFVLYFLLNSRMFTSIGRITL